MSRHTDFMTDPAFAKAVEGAMAGITLIQDCPHSDPIAAARLVAMSVLVAYANGGGLEDPHIGRLIRFAPDLGCEAPGPHDA